MSHGIQRGVALCCLETSRTFQNSVVCDKKVSHGSKTKQNQSLKTQKTYTGDRQAFKPMESTNWRSFRLCPKVSRWWLGT